MVGHHRLCKIAPFWLLAALGLAVAGCTNQPAKSAATSQTPPSSRHKHLIFLLDCTGFIRNDGKNMTDIARQRWKEVLDSVAAIAQQQLRGGDIITIIAITNYSYQDTNVLLGPHQLDRRALAVVTELPKLIEDIRALQPARPVPLHTDGSTTTTLGTDYRGALKLAAEAARSWSTAKTYVLVYGDLVEEHVNPRRVGEPVAFPPGTQAACLYVERTAKGASARDKAIQSFRKLLAEFGIAGDVPVFGANESRADQVTSNAVMAKLFGPSGG